MYQQWHSPTSSADRRQASVIKRSDPDRGWERIGRYHNTLTDTPTQGWCDTLTDTPTQGWCDTLTDTPTQGWCDTLTDTPTQGWCDTLTDTPTQGWYDTLTDTPTQGWCDTLTDTPTQGWYDTLTDTPTLPLISVAMLLVPAWTAYCKTRNSARNSGCQILYEKRVKFREKQHSLRLI